MTSHLFLCTYDEPVFALDVSVQAQILNLLQDLQEKLGLSYLFISHDMSVIRYVADRIGVMYVGKLVEYAPREELLRNPAHPYTEALQSAVPRLTVRHRRDRIVLEGSPPDPSDLPGGCVYHTRCRYAEAVCREQEPELRAIGEGHFVACHLADDLDLKGIELVSKTVSRRNNLGSTRAIPTSKVKKPQESSADETT